MNMKTHKIALILVAFVSSYQLSTTKVFSIDLVHQVCQKTSNPNLCVSTLNSDPKSVGTGTKGLAHIMSQKAENSANETRDKVIPKLLGEIKDPVVVEKLKNCDKIYGMMLIDFSLAIQYLDSGKYKMAIDFLGSAAKFADACEKIFTVMPEKRPSPITDRDKLVMDLAGLAQDIIHLLG